MTTLTGVLTEKGTTTGVAGAALQPYTTLVWLQRAATVHARADSSSPVVGSLAAGADVPALQVVSGTAKGADFVRVPADDLPGGAGWVRSRSRTTHVALLHDEPVPWTSASTAADGTFEVQVPDDAAPDQLYRLRSTDADHLDGESVRGYAALEFHLAVEPLTAAVREPRLVDLLHHFRGWFYTPLKEPGNPGAGRFVPQYPYDIGVTVKLDTKHPARTTYNDCCSFVEALLVRGWRDAAVPGFSWDKVKHGRAMILDASKPFSPVEVLEDVGVADAVDPDELPPPWTVVQVWRRLTAIDPATKKTVPSLFGGHTMLIVETHRETGRLLTLESNLAFGLDGPGFRRLGGVDGFLRTHYRCPTGDYVYDPMLGDPEHGVSPGSVFLAPAVSWQWWTPPAVVPEDWVCPVDGAPKAQFVPYCRPPRDWWKSTALPTWDAFKVTYPHRRMARLRLRELTWLR